MTSRDNYHGQGFEQALETQTLTGDANGDTIDTQGFDSVALAVAVGQSGDTLSGSLKIELEVEHADDDGTGSPDTWEDCADDDLLNFVSGTNNGTFAVIDDAAEDQQVYATGYKGDRRFVRVVANLTGTHTNGTPVGAVAIKGHPHFSPVN